MPRQPSADQPGPPEPTAPLAGSFRAVPPSAWGLPSAPAQPAPRQDTLTGTFGHRKRREPRPRRTSRRRWLLAGGLVLGVLGLAAATFGLVVQFLPRTFSPSQRAQITAWEVANRWREWPAGHIFPTAVPYTVPGSAFGGGPNLSLTARRVGINRRTACQGATDATTSQLLTRGGCLAVLRATYEDQTQDFAVTVGVAVLGQRRQAHGTHLLRSDGPQAAVRPVAFRRTSAARFSGASQRLSWDTQTGPYLVMATVGYADGRPWLRDARDSYTQSEMLALAQGVGHNVASRLGAAPPQPRCPGSPGC